MIKTTKTFEFEAAHLLPNYDGDCRNLHGHTYKFELTVGRLYLENDDMVIDYSDLNDMVDEAILKYIDHSVILGDSPVERLLGNTLKSFSMKIYEIKGRSTAESLCKIIAVTIANDLEHNGKIFDIMNVKLWETSKNCAEYTFEVE